MDFQERLAKVGESINVLKGLTGGQRNADIEKLCIEVLALVSSADGRQSGQEVDFVKLVLETYFDSSDALERYLARTQTYLAPQSGLPGYRDDVVVLFRRLGGLPELWRKNIAIFAKLVADSDGRSSEENVLLNSLLWALD